MTREQIANVASVFAQWYMYLGDKEKNDDFDTWLKIHNAFESWAMTSRGKSMLAMTENYTKRLPVKELYDGLLKAVGTDDDMMASITYKGDPSVGINDQNYVITLPNILKHAADDKECMDWAEELRRLIGMTYSFANDEGGIEVAFEYEFKADFLLEQMDTIEPIKEEYPIQDETWPSRRWNRERTEYEDLSGNGVSDNHLIPPPVAPEKTSYNSYKLGDPKPDEDDFQIGGADPSGEVYDMTDPVYYEQLEKWKQAQIPDYAITLQQFVEEGALSCVVYLFKDDYIIRKQYEAGEETHYVISIDDAEGRYLVRKRPEETAPFDVYGILPDGKICPVHSPFYIVELNS